MNPPDALPTLLDRRLVIVTGKGGTGKTTVVATLALAAAAAGRRVLVAEVSPDEHVPRLLEPGAKPVGYEGRTVRKGLHAMRVDPYEALAEYLGLQIGLRGVVRRVLGNQAFRQLMDASPGWRELITLGKIFHLHELDRPDGRTRFDLIVIDAPATGHGLTFLDVPRVVGSAVRAGPLRRNASRVEAMIRDHEGTLLLPVSLAEELPARETTELVARLRDDVGVAVDRVVVNAVSEAPFPAGLEDLDARLGALDPALELPGSPSPGTLTACAAWARGRHELNRRWLDVVGRETGLPLVLLPRLARGVAGPDDLERLAGALLAAPRSVS
ncbi:MAG: ArsA-related P-loop ATPase [Myxococcota bacterium]|nr:ArsA-related P-loop ATPase [Myxococcota bacterium]